MATNTKDLKTLSKTKVAEEYAITYTAPNPGARDKHIHDVVIELLNATATHFNQVYPKIDISTLRDVLCKNVAEHLYDGLAPNMMGIRPNTEFHENNQGRYPANPVDPHSLGPRFWEAIDAKRTRTISQFSEDLKYLDGHPKYRYLELHSLGGGMRLIYDSKIPVLFVSAHYSNPAILVASKDPERTRLDETIRLIDLARKGILCQMMGTDQSFLERHNPIFAEYNNVRRRGLANAN